MTKKIESKILAQQLAGEALAEEIQEPEEPEALHEQPPTRDFIGELRGLGPQYGSALESLGDLEAINFDVSKARHLLKDYQDLMQEGEAIKHELANLRPSPLLREKVSELSAIRAALEPSALSILREFLALVDKLRMQAFFTMQEVLDPLQAQVDQADAIMVRGLSRYTAGLEAACQARAELQKISGVFYRISQSMPEVGIVSEPTWRMPWGPAVPAGKQHFERLLQRRFADLRGEKPGQELTLKDFKVPAPWHM